MADADVGRIGHSSELHGYTQVCLLQVATAQSAIGDFGTAVPGCAAA